jgi:hypothetical protein
MTMQPIYDHRHIIGHASNAQQAARIVRQTHQTIPPGWRVTIRQRDISIIDLPQGWIYSIHP